MTAQSRFRVLRWSAPALVAAGVGLAASGVFTADADPPLPARTAAQLLADVQTVQVAGLSGTIVQTSKLGLPELPAVGNGSDITPTALLTGSHQLRVWLSGPTRQRMALLGSLGESDAVHNGTDLWLWTSSTNAVTHVRLPGTGAVGGDHPPTPTALTPQQAADMALKAIDPTTKVSTDGTASVAGRPVYELVLSPRDTRSLVGQVRIAVDAQTRMPLRVQVYGKRSGAGPAFEVGFTRISFAVPGDDQFRFVPPPGAKVTESAFGAVDHPGATPDKGKGAPAATDTAGSTRLVGAGWTTVAVFDGVQAPIATGSGRSRDAQGQLAGLLGQLPQVSGSWGSGRLMTGTVFSALLTNDGRLLVGAVSPDLLYQAAGHR